MPAAPIGGALMNVISQYTLLMSYTCALLIYMNYDDSLKDDTVREE